MSQKMQEDAFFHIIIKEETFNKLTKGMVYRKLDKVSWFKKVFGVVKEWERYFLLEWAFVKGGTAKVLVKKGTKYIDAPWGIQAEEIIFVEYDN